MIETWKYLLMFLVFHHLFISSSSFQSQHSSELSQIMKTQLHSAIFNQNIVVESNCPVKKLEYFKSAQMTEIFSMSKVQNMIGMHHSLTLTLQNITHIVFLRILTFALCFYQNWTKDHPLAFLDKGVSFKAGSMHTCIKTCLKEKVNFHRWWGQSSSKTRTWAN